jgi:uncharacterized membrane protein YheB (UPF0754 family)
MEEQRYERTFLPEPEDDDEPKKSTIKSQLMIVFSLFAFEALLVTILWAANLFDENTSIWLYVSMPPMSGFVGYLTNVVALFMTFEPLEFTGIPFLMVKDQPFGLFGWQGIIPAKCGKMASIAVDLMLEKLIDIREVFDRLDPDRVVEILEPGLLTIMKTMVNKLGKEQADKIWETTPEYIKEELYREALSQTPVMIHGLLQDMKDNLEEVLDLKKMVVRKFLLEKNLLNELFKTCGADEFIFIERSGFYFGFIFGIVQMVVFIFYDADWVLPVFGFIVGWLTNFLALKMIFEPVEPIYLCGGKIKLHGLFLQRQQEVSKIFAKMTAEKTMTSKLIWDEVLYGPNVEYFEQIVRKHTEKTVDRLLGPGKPILGAYLSAKRTGMDYDYDAVKDRICDQVVAELPHQVGLLHEYTDEALEVEREIREVRGVCLHHYLFTSLASNLHISPFSRLFSPCPLENERPPLGGVRSRAASSL